MRSILSAGGSSTYISDASRITAITKEEEEEDTETYNATLDKLVDDTKLQPQLVMQCSIQIRRC